MQNSMKRNLRVKERISPNLYKYNADFKLKFNMSLVLM